MKHSTVTDPVCGMKIDPAEAAATVEHDGRTYHFCAVSCSRTFEKSPEAFAHRGEEPKEKSSCCGSSCCRA